MGLAPGELCIAENAKVGRAYTHGELRTISSSGFLSPLSSLAEIQGSADGNRCERGVSGGMCCW